MVTVIMETINMERVTVQIITIKTATMGTFYRLPTFIKRLEIYPILYLLCFL
jgi:hypothetical protein